MPLLSVIVPTIRIGGLDVLFAGLKKQLFTDFELILVDGLHERREEIVAQKAAAVSFPVKHVPPRDNPFPVNSYQRSVNTGVSYASGDVCYFTCDYAWLAPDCLAGHAEWYLRRGIGKEAVLAPMHIHRTPKIASSFPVSSYGLASLGDMESDEGKKRTMALWEIDGVRHDAIKRWMRAYLRDLYNDKLDPLMWTIFDKEFSSSDDPRMLDLIHVEEKASRSTGQIHHYFCHLKNDSIPTQALLDINGFDEDFDGCHGWQDSEVADRLALKAGVQFNLIHGHLVHLLDVHHLMILRQIYRHERANEALMFAKRQTGYSKPTNPQFDLSYLRRKALSK